MNGRERERILVVDDDRAVRRAITRVLEGHYEVVGVETPAEAMQVLDQAHIHLALIDVQLHDPTDGFALCSSVRAAFPETDVILITGSASAPDDKLYRALDRDAFYFLFKPFQSRVLLALVERCLRLQREQRENQHNARELVVDLKRAANFQLKLLPTKALYEQGWKVGGSVRPCEALGGDFYLHLRHDDERLLFAIADVVGHGVRAALYAGMIWSSLSAARRQDPTPDVVINKLLEGMEDFEATAHSSLFYGILHKEGRMEYVSAGHPPGVLLRADGTCERIESTGLVLSGVFPDHPRETVNLEFNSGDRLLLYTDGATEANDPQGAELGEQGLIDALEADRGLAFEDVPGALLASIDAFCNGRPIQDDITLLVIERE